LEEAEVLVQFLLPAGGDALAEGDRGAEARRVFVDVEGAIKMRDAQTLQLQVLVELKIRPEVEVEELSILAADGVDRQRPAGFDQGVRDLLELGEHGLADNGAADLVDGVVDQI